MNEPTNPGIFHIHADAKIMPDDLRDYLVNFGFYEDSFIGHPEGYNHFEPNAHMTKKVQRGSEFHKAWEEVEKMAEQTGFIGYLEGEHIPSDELIPVRHSTVIPVPFQIRRRRLDDSESFRQTELHLTMDKDASNQRLMKSLLDAGLYGAYLPKREKVYVVLTAQGYRYQIAPLMNSLRVYLCEAGGAVNCTLKEERVVTYRLFGINAADLPEIIDRVDFTSR